MLSYLIDRSEMFIVILTFIGHNITNGDKQFSGSDWKIDRSHYFRCVKF